MLEALEERLQKTTRAGGGGGGHEELVRRSMPELVPTADVGLALQLRLCGQIRAAVLLKVQILRDWQSLRLFYFDELASDSVVPNELIEVAAARALFVRRAHALCD